MRSVSFCLLCLLALCTQSCKKKKPDISTPPPVSEPPVYPDYFQLKPGNYWIYQDYKVDSVGGEAHALNHFDSCYVEKDTLINGVSYHKYCSTGDYTNSKPAPSFFRDSLLYVVDNSGIIRFSWSDFTHVFRSYTVGPDYSTPDTLHITEQMGFKNAAVTVDAGSFTTSTFRRIIRYPSGYQYGPTREYNYRYAAKVGLVSATTGIFQALPSWYEKRLVRYHVQ